MPTPLDAAIAAAAALRTADELNAVRARIDAQLATAPDPVLSAKEAAAVRLIALGYSNKEIAAHFGLSVKTIETFKSRAMEKLKIRTRPGLVQYALRRGWLTDAGAVGPPVPTIPGTE